MTDATGVRGLGAALGGLAQSPGRLHRMPLPRLLKRDHVERSSGTSALLRGPPSYQLQVGPGEGPGSQPEAAPQVGGVPCGPIGQPRSWLASLRGRFSVGQRPLGTQRALRSSPPGLVGIAPLPLEPVFPDPRPGLGCAPWAGRSEEGPRTRTGPRLGVKCYHDSTPAPRWAVPARQWALLVLPQGGVPFT